MQFAFALISIAFLYSVAWSHIPIPPKSPANIGRRQVKISVPDFNLKDQDGKTFRFANLRGQLVVITFIFTGNSITTFTIPTLVGP